jgi:hypothetical protein
MTTRIWTGGGDNRPTNAQNWSVPGAPRPGDELWMGGGTMNIAGGSLAGNPLRVEASYIPGFTLYDLPRSPATTPVVNLSQGAHVRIDAFLMTEATINVVGSDTLDLHASAYRPSNFGTRTITVNLAPHATWTGAFMLQGAGVTGLTVNGNDGAVFRNGHSNLSELGNAVINADVLGVGSFDLQFHNRLELGGRVGAGQTINQYGGELVVDKPAAFFGTVNLMPSADFKLLGLGAATSYSYKNDMLSIYNGDRVIDRVHVKAADPAMALQVAKSVSGLEVIGGLPGSPMVLDPGSAWLPVHA